MKAIHRLEPLWWLLFGAGGFLAAMLLPALLFGVGIAAPQGWFSEYAISFHRVHGLAANPLGRLLLVALFSLTFWHSAHHLRHFALDLGLKRHQGPISVGLYGLALLGTLVSIALVGRL